MSAGFDPEIHVSGGKESSELKGTPKIAIAIAMSRLQGEETMEGRAKIGFGIGNDHYPYRNLSARVRTNYELRVYSKEGKLKWTENFHNLLTTEGLNQLLDATLKTGLASPAWYVGLVSGATTPAYDQADVIGKHDGWTEFTDYAEGDRVPLVLGDIADGMVDNSASPAKFTISKAGSIAGCFIVGKDGGGGTSGVLYGEGAFSGGAFRAVEPDDNARVTVTLSLGN